MKRLHSNLPVLSDEQLAAECWESMQYTRDLVNELKSRGYAQKCQGYTTVAYPSVQLFSFVKIEEKKLCPSSSS